MNDTRPWWPTRSRPQPYMSPPRTCLIDTLPDEVVLEVLSYLDLSQLMALRPTSKRFAALALSPPLLRHLTLKHLSVCPLPEILRCRILPHVRHLKLSLSSGMAIGAAIRRSAKQHEWGWVHPSATVLALLQAIPDDSLHSLVFSQCSHYMHWEELGPELARIGGKLEVLDLSVSGLVGRHWVAWGAVLGVRGRGLRHVDLAGNGITALPPPSSWPAVETLSLRSCSLLPRSLLTSFLADLPTTMEQLDVSYLQQVTLSDLHGMRVVTDHGGEVACTALKAVNIVGIDHLTRSDVRTLQAHWAKQRSVCPSDEIDELQPTWSSPSPSSSVDIPSRRQMSRGFAADEPPSLSSSASSTSSSWPTPQSPSSPLLAAFAQSPNTYSTPAKQIRAPTSSWSPSSYSRASISASSNTSVFTPRWTSSFAQWSSSFTSILEGTKESVTIVHNALLESDDEAGYRQFIGEITAGMWEDE